MALLPSVFILQSGSRYLNLTKNIPTDLPYGFLKFDEEQIWSPRVRFAAEPAKTGNGRFVHIRSLYNNKYLVRKQIDETKSSIFVASAKNTEEDTSKDSCTLFEPYSLEDDEPTVVRLRQVQPKNFVTFHSTSHIDPRLASSTKRSFFNVIDAASVVVLPTKVAIWANDDILQSRNINASNYQQFIPGSELAEPRAAKELIPTSNGNYRIKDVTFGQFFTRHTTWIWADAEESDTSKNTTFSFVVIDNNNFGIRNLGNNYFCGAKSKNETVKNCLSAYFPTLTKQTRLTVTERVLKRYIYDVEYRLTDVKIHDPQMLEVDTKTINNQTDSVSEDTLDFPITKSRTSSWTSSQTINFGVEVTMAVTAVPLIVSGEVQLRAGYSSTHSWGKSESTEVVRQSNHSVTVPPHKKYKMSLMTTMGKCDVPFSYTQRDLLTTGEWVVTKKDDGVFSDVNNFNFYYEVVEVK